MRLLVNENVAANVILGLRRAGHDVLSAKESMRSRPDAEILAKAQAEQRIVVIHDKDFGELAFRSGLPATCGVILFRLIGEDRDADVKRVLEVLLSGQTWAGWFAVADETRIRMRRLPSAAGQA